MITQSLNQWRGRQTVGGPTVRQHFPKRGQITCPGQRRALSCLSLSLAHAVVVHRVGGYHRHYRPVLYIYAGPQDMDAGLNTAAAWLGCMGGPSCTGVHSPWTARQGYERCRSPPDAMAQRQVSAGQIWFIHMGVGRLYRSVQPSVSYPYPGPSVSQSYTPYTIYSTNYGTVR